MRIRTALLTAFVTLVSSGCVAAAVNTSAYAVKGLPRAELEPLAESGDATAQYALGNAWCCMGPGFDTQTATEWYCRAALQGNADAMYELGRIYLGDVSRTPAPGQKLRRALSARRSPTHAHLWLSLAASLSHPGAAGKLAALDAEIAADERAEAQRLAADWRGAPCEYDDVFPD